MIHDSAEGRIWMTSFKAMLLIAILIAPRLVWAADKQPSTGNHATFIFPKSTQVKVNGVQVLPRADNIAKEIPLKASGFDRIDVLIGDKKSTTLAKFRNGEQYHVWYNPCSFFQIVPKLVESDQENIYGSFKYQVDPQAKQPFWFQVGLSSETTRVSPGKTSQRLENPVSANCSFARTFFYVLAQDPAESIDPPPIAEISFQFLHNEQIVVRYVEKTRSLQVTLERTAVPASPVKQ
jgi:hypothetical protein